MRPGPAEFSLTTTTVYYQYTRIMLLCNSLALLMLVQCPNMFFVAIFKLLQTCERWFFLLKQAPSFYMKWKRWPLTGSKTFLPFSGMREAARLVYIAIHCRQTANRKQQTVSTARSKKSNLTCLALSLFLFSRVGTKQALAPIIRKQSSWKAGTYIYVCLLWMCGWSMAILALTTVLHSRFCLAAIILSITNILFTLVKPNIVSSKKTSQKQSAKKVRIFMRKKCYSFFAFEMDGQGL